MSKGCHRVQVHGSYRRKQASDRAGEKQRKRSTCECEGIGDGEREEHMRNRVRCSERTWRAYGYAGEGDQNTLTEDETQDAAALRAHGHADSDLAGTQVDSIGHETEESKACNEQRDGSKERRERGGSERWRRRQTARMAS